MHHTMGQPVSTGLPQPGAQARHTYKKDAIVEDDESNPASRLGKAVAASAIGLSGDQWDQSLEIEAYLDHPFQSKDSGPFTGAIALFLLHDLKKGCSDDKALTVKISPPTAKLEDRGPF